MRRKGVAIMAKERKKISLIKQFRMFISSGNVSGMAVGMLSTP